jgi:hypothetical protein
MIKFANCALTQFKEHANSGERRQDDLARLDNIDVHNARVDYSEYFLREIDDEVHKHMPQYQRHLDILRNLGTWQFDREVFEVAFKASPPENDLSPIQALERLYDFSFIGFYRAGGRGFGGSEYTFKYREPRVHFDSTSTKYRIHPGLIEVLGLKRK